MMTILLQSLLYRSGTCLIGALFMVTLSAQTNWYPAEVFGTTGVLNTDISIGPDEMVRHQLQADGKVLLVGGGYDGGCNCHYISLMRADTTCGALDPAFGTGGKVRHVFDQRSSLVDAAVLADGKILGCGFSAPGNGASQQNCAVYRFNADGSPDVTFNGSGWSAERFAPNLTGGHLAVLPMNNGRLCVVGGSYQNIDGSVNGRGIMRYKADGTLDTDYSGDGKHWIQNAIALYGQAGLMLADSSVLWIATDVSAGNIAFTRFALDGSTTEHSVAAGPGNNLTIRAVNLPDGRFLLGYTNAAGVAVVARINADLTLDATYGVGGTSDVDPSLGNDRAIGLELLEDGSTLQFGGWDGAAVHFVIKRTPEGSVDPSFGANGVLTLPASGAMVSTRGGLVLPGGTGLLTYGTGAANTAMLRKMTTQPEVNALPVITVQGEQLLVSGGGDVQWSYQGLPLDGATTSAITPLDEGTYTAVTTLTDACVFQAASYQMLGNHLFSVTPATISTDNTHILRLHGSFYFDTATVVLRQGATEFTAHRVSVNDVLELAAVITLTDAPLGAYDVIVYRNGYADTLFAAVNVVHPVEDVGSLLQLESIGPWRTLVGTEYVHTIRVHNPTSQAVVGASVVVLITGEGDVRIELMNDVVQHAFTDSLRTHLMHQRDFLRISPQEWLGPDSVTYGFFGIPYISANSFQDIQFRSYSNDLRPFDLLASIGRPMLTNEEIEGLELLRTSCDFFPNAIQCLLDVGGQVPGEACAANAFSLGCGITNSINDYLSNSEDLSGDVVSILTDFLAILSCGVPGGAGAFVASDDARLLLAFAGQQISFFSNLTSGSTPDIRVPTSYALPASCIRTPKDAWTWGAKRRVHVLASIDPNEKRGPVGSGNAAYTHRNKQMDYTIAFENAPIATAPAREVFLIDTLDLTTLDPATFRFVGFGFDTVSTTLTEGRQSLITDVDLRPSKEAIVRVVGSIDVTTGVVRTSFRTFDPTTQQLTTDVDAGFLDPNTNGTEGLGSVSFIVDQRPDLAHLTPIANEAAIIFDANEAIITAPHVNRIDHAAPTSEVLATTSFSNDTLLIEWEAADAHAGLRSIELVIVRNETDTFTLVMPSTATGPVELVDAPFNTFRLYTVAIDSVGNRELPPANGYDVEVAMIGTGIAERTLDGALSIFPNPAAGAFALHHTLVNAGSVEVQLLDQQGRTVAQLLPLTTYPIGALNLQLQLPESLAAGVYNVLLRNGSTVHLALLMHH